MVEFPDIEEFKLPAEIAQSVTTDQAWHYGIIPKEKNSKSIVFYVNRESNVEKVKSELEVLTGMEIKLLPADSKFIQKALSKFYRKNKKLNSSAQKISHSEDFLVKIITEANSLTCSDIHIEIYEEKCRVRFRLDGKLIERYILHKEEYPAIVNKIKIRANLDIAEKRLPQDGRIFFSENNKKFDIRVSILPALHGEKIVLRLLSKDTTNIDIEQLGFDKHQLDFYLEGIKKPHGLVLISGPTGSGKTTTLYATLKILNKEQTNILTIEDPIEYTLEGINQVQLKESIGLTFSSALRTFLRQDPDIIMLGEIRDSETAQMAIRAALTGHLVLSTIHTNSAWGTVSRLIDMEVPAFLLANTLNITVAQRLVRLLCPQCKKEEPFNQALFPKKYKYDKLPEKHFVSVGCDSCYHTGYKGRKAVYEVIPIDYEFSERIKMSQLDIGDLLKEKDIRSLSQSAFELFQSGFTSIEEIYSLLMNT